ncbi:hypothetical protein PtB15_2B417 [Puccinia triticina]|nr:hypothetical protein PtB15_2B417 [Puccinia triticina]
MNIDNFDAMLANPFGIIKDTTIQTMTRKRKPNATKGTCNLPPEVQQHLVNHLVEGFRGFFNSLPGSESHEHVPSTFFGYSQATMIVGSLDQVQSSEDHDLQLIFLEKLMGGQYFSGQVNWLKDSLKSWFDGEFHQAHLQQRRDHKKYMEEKYHRLRREIHAEEEAIEADRIALLESQALARAAGRAELKAIKEKEDAARKEAEKIAKSQARAAKVAIEEARKLAARKAKAEARMAAREVKAQAAMQEAAKKAAERREKVLAREEARLEEENRKAEERRLRRETRVNNKKKAHLNRLLQKQRNCKQVAKEEGDRVALEEFKDVHAQGSGESMASTSACI